MLTRAPRDVWRLRISLDAKHPRYFFTNSSPDIRALFAATCALVAVDCRPAGRRNLSVARRRSVEILDRLVGPKR